jgi:hypothetical protein
MVYLRVLNTPPGKMPLAQSSEYRRVADAWDFEQLS